MSELTHIQEAAFSCFTQKKGCNVVLREGEPVKFAAGTIGIFGKNVIQGTTPEGDHKEILLSNIARLEPID